MDSQPPITINLVIIIISLLCFVILLLLSYLFPYEKNRRLHTFFNNLAFVCVPAFLIGVCDRLFLIDYFLEDTEQVIEQKLIKPFGDYVGNLEEYGLQGMHPPIDFNIIFQEMEPGGTLKIHDTVIPDIHKTFPSLREALDRGVHLEVLVSHPESQITKFRSIEIGPEWDYEKSFRPAIYGYISHFQAIVKEEERTRAPFILMRYYEDLPSVPMYILDNPGDSNDKLYHGYFLANSSVEVPHVEIVRKDKGLYDSFFQYFSEKWNRNAINEIDLVNFDGPGSLPPPKFPSI